MEGSPSCEEGGGRVYVGCYDSRLYCLDMLTGQIIWSFQAKVRYRISYNTGCNYIQISFSEKNSLIFGFVPDPFLNRDLFLYIFFAG